MKQRDDGAWLLALISPVIELIETAARFRLIRFLWRIAKFAAIITGIFAVLTLIPEAAATWLVVFLSPFIGGLLLAGLLYLLMTGRVRTLLMIVLAVLCLAAGQYWSMIEAVDQVERLDQRQFLPAKEKHAHIVYDWSTCHSLCVEILSRSDYVLAFEQPGAKTWTVFSKASGTACLDAKARESHRTFLSAIGLCVVSSEEPVGMDALIVKLNYDRRAGIHGTMPDNMPRSFDGKVYELYERTNGEERLLGRWVSGYVRPVSYWFGLVGLRGMRVGVDFEEQDFYRAALNIPLSAP
jgi:hypothetical protein